MLTVSDLMTTDPDTVTPDTPSEGRNQPHEHCSAAGSFRLWMQWGASWALSPIVMCAW